MAENKRAQVDFGGFKFEMKLCAVLYRLYLQHTNVLYCTVQFVDAGSAYCNVAA